MYPELTPGQLTGLDETHLVTLPGGHRLIGEVAEAFDDLKQEAARSGFNLVIASSYRSFSRQLDIWNGKASGARPVHDDAGSPVAVASLTPAQRVYAILRFSAIPGTSRHHWGTDIDVYDAAAADAAAAGEGYQVRLSPSEVAPGGLFDPLHRWLDERMAAGTSCGFYRPYNVDRGGVAPERWHLSYAALSEGCAANCTQSLLRGAWDSAADDSRLLLRTEIEAHWPEIYRRFIAVPRGWANRGGGA